MKFVFRSTLLFALFFTLIDPNLSAQCDFPEPPGLGVFGCNEAPLFCSEATLDGYCSTTFPSGVGLCPPTFCGSCENYHWFSFVATNSDFGILVTPSNCVGTGMGSGIQAHLYQTEDCLNFSPISNCESPGVEAPIVVNASNLQIGQVYHLMIDGWAGDVCDYEIEVITPYFDLDPPIIQGPIDGDLSVGIGAEVIYTVPDNPSIIDYEWTVDPQFGQIAAGQGGPEVTIEWNVPGIAQLCVTPSNNCEVGPTVCTIVEITPIPPTFIYEDLCIGDCFEYNNVDYCLPGVYNFVFETPNGDSIVNLVLNSVGPFISVEQLSICPGQTYEFCGNIVTGPGAVQCTFTSYQGCDSLVTYIIQEGEDDFTLIKDTICEGQTYVLGNEEYTEQGIYFQELTNQFGCDSIVKLKLRVFPTSGMETMIDTTICQFDTINIEGTPLFETGIYEIPIFGNSICEELITVNLTVEPAFLDIQSDTICANETYVYDGNVFTEPGTYNIAYEVPGNCDSVVVLTLHPGGFYREVSRSGCFGDEFVFMGVTYDETGIYTIDLPSNSVCDSTIVLDLFIAPELVLEDVEIQPSEGTGMGSITPTIAGGVLPYDYEWENGFTTPNRVDLNEGIYFLTVTDAQGCTLELEFEVPSNLVDPSDRSLTQRNFKVHLSPNPVSNGQMIQIQTLSDNPDKIQKVKIFDVQGRQVSIQNFNLNTSSSVLLIEAPTLPGLYFISVTTGNGEVFVEKLVVTGG